MDVFIYLGLVLVLILVAAVVILVVRQWIFGYEASIQQGFTLQELRDLKRRGQLSDEEYKAARAAILGAVAPKQEVIDPASSEESGDSDSSGPPG